VSWLSEFRQIDFTDVLTLLEAAGLIRSYGSPTTDDPVDVRPIASILNLPPVPSPTEASFSKRLCDGLSYLLAKIYGFSIDFFRPGRNAGKQIVPESVFSAFLAMGLEYLGWEADREVQMVAGRSDIRVKRPGEDRHGIVEVKIWGRNDYQSIQNQVES
jgi:hypothetical protein